MESTQSPNPVMPPKNWLLESILVTLFCCLPLGIVGIVNASKVNTAFVSGNHGEALRLSKEAGRWTKYGFYIGLAIIIIYIICVVLFGVGSFMAMGR